MSDITIKIAGKNVVLKVEPPGNCNNCEATPEEMKEVFSSGWIRFQMPNTNFAHFQCPCCGNLQGAKDAAKNATLIQQMLAEKKTSKILAPQGGRIIQLKDSRLN